MDLELEEINRLCDELSILEKEEIEYRNKKNTELGIYLILSFLNLMIYYIKFIVDYLHNERKKIDKKYYSVEDLD